MSVSKVCERDARIRSDLKNSIKDGCTYSVMVGIGESYIAALVLALGFSQLSSALITTLPLLAGAILQLISPHIVKRTGSYSRWVVATASIQAASFFLFVAAALTKSFPLWAIYMAASLYWAASMATGPAWNAWVATLIPAKIRTEYFSHRSRLTYAATLLGLVLGGILLELGRNRGLELQTFALIFVMAALLRFASAFYLAQHSETKGLAKKIRILSFRETYKKIRGHNYGRILTYLFFFQIAVNISSSYINPFMLSQMKLHYWAYMAMLSAMALSKAIAMPFTLRLIKKFGLKKILMGASLGIAPLPALWLVAQQDISWVAALQIFSGFVWASHELAAFLILFGEIPEEDRASVLTEFNLFNTVGIVLGSIAGGVIFHNMGQNFSGYFAIFCLSTLLRFACLVMIPGMGSPIKKAGLRIYYRTLGVRNGGGITRPIITDDFDSAQKSRQQPGKENGASLAKSPS